VTRDATQLWKRRFTCRDHKDWSKVEININRERLQGDIEMLGELRHRGCRHFRSCLELASIAGFIPFVVKIASIQRAPGQSQSSLNPRHSRALRNEHIDLLILPNDKEHFNNDIHDGSTRLKEKRSQKLIGLPGDR